MGAEKNPVPVSSPLIAHVGKGECHETGQVKVGELASISANASNRFPWSNTATVLRVDDYDNGHHPYGYLRSLIDV